MKGAHRVYRQASNSWLTAYIVGGLYLCVCLTYAVTS
jgi:hypothetical protein